MPFRLSKDAREWFRDIEDGFDLDFDIYYLCLMAGLATGKKGSVPTTQAPELVDYFPVAYQSKGRVIVALFLSKELEALGISMSERDQVYGQIARMVDPLTQSGLSHRGMEEMNRYSYGGFDVLANEWFEDRPRIIEAFLPLYKEKIKSKIPTITP